MAGLIGSAQAPAAPVAAAPQNNTGVVDAKNPLLANIEQKMSMAIKPTDKQSYLKIILAGRKIMFDKQTHSIMMSQLNQPGDLMDNVVKGAVLLMMILYKNSKDSMPIPLIIPAAIILMCDALDFLEQTGKIKVDPDSLANATQALVGYLMQKMNLTPAKVQELTAQAKQIQAAKAGAQPQPSAPTPAAPAQGV